MRIKNEQKKTIPIIGNIRVGEKSDKGYPTSLDYFKATGRNANEFHKIYGEKPQNIEIIFLDDENSLDVRYELRNGTKLFAYSDGENVYAFHKEINKYCLGDKNFNELKDIYAKKLNSKWDKVLRLYFRIPLIKIVGVWKFETKGDESTIPQIEGGYDIVQHGVGSVVNIPFDLSVKKVTSQKPDSKNSFPVVSLVANLSESMSDKLRKCIVNGIEIPGVITEEKLNLIELKEV